MYDYSYSSDGYETAANMIGIFAGLSIVMWIIALIIAIFSLICMWKLFIKAGKKGWASIIPIYNVIVMIEIAELPMWYIALLFVPFANIYAVLKIFIEIAHKFGKSTGFGVGMFFLGIIFIPIVVFGKTEYKANTKDIQGVSANNDGNLVSDSILPSQFSVNDNFNIQNNNSIFNVMDVNSGIGVTSISDVNIQNNGSMFQPAGNVNNNIYSNNVNLMSDVLPNNTDNNLNNVNNMSFNNTGMMTNSVNNLVNNTANVISEQNMLLNQNMDVVNVNNNMMTNSVNNLVNNTENVIPEQNMLLNQNMNVVNANNNMMTNSVNNLVNNVVGGVSEQNQVSNVNINNMKKMCPYCGTQIDFNVMVCGHCGNNL